MSLMAKLLKFKKTLPVGYYVMLLVALVRVVSSMGLLKEAGIEPIVHCPLQNLKIARIVFEIFYWNQLPQLILVWYRSVILEYQKILLKISVK